MKKIIIITTLLLLAFSVQAEEINEKYSFKSFPVRDLSFKDRPASEFNNTTIKNSSFYQLWKEGDQDGIVRDIFPDGMTGVLFLNCNLDNVYIPSGNELKHSSNKKIAIQNDLSDWILDNTLRPVEPLDKEDRIKRGVSIDPKDIPSKKFTKEQRRAFEDIAYRGIDAIIIPDGEPEVNPESGFFNLLWLLCGGVFLTLLGTITYLTKKWLKK